MVDTVKAVIEAEDRFSGTFAKYGQSLQGAIKETDGMNVSLGKMGAAFGLASVGFSTLADAAAGAARGMVALSQEFDNATDSIRLSTGATGAQLTQLEAIAERTLGTVTQGFQEITATQNAFTVRLGLGGEELERVNKQYLDFARLTGVDAAGSVRQLTRFMQDWGISADQTEATMDKLLRMQQRSGQAWTEATQPLVFYGTTLRALGVTTDEALALQAKWEREGVNVETVMGGMRIAAVRLAEANLDGATIFKEAIADIKAAATEDEATQISRALVGQRAAQDFAKAVREGRFDIVEDYAAIAQGSETVEKANDAVRGSAEELAEAWGKVTLALKPAAQGIETLAASLLTGLVPAIQAVQTHGDTLKLLAQLSGGAVAPFAVGVPAAVGAVRERFGGGETTAAAEVEQVTEATAGLARATTEVAEAQREGARSGAEWNRMLEDQESKAKAAAKAQADFLKEIGRNLLRDALELAQFNIRETNRAFEENFRQQERAAKEHQREQERLEKEHQRELERIYKDSVEGRLDALREQFDAEQRQREAEDRFAAERGYEARLEEQIDLLHRQAAATRLAADAQDVFARSLEQTQARTEQQLRTAGQSTLGVGPLTVGVRGTPTGTAFDEGQIQAALGAAHQMQLIQQGINQLIEDRRFDLAEEIALMVQQNDLAGAQVAAQLAVASAAARVAEQMGRARAQAIGLLNVTQSIAALGGRGVGAMGYGWNPQTFIPGGLIPPTTYHALPAGGGEGFGALLSGASGGSLGALVHPGPTGTYIGGEGDIGTGLPLPPFDQDWMGINLQLTLEWLEQQARQVYMGGKFLPALRAAIASRGAVASGGGDTVLTPVGSSAGFTSGMGGRGRYGGGAEAFGGNSYAINVTLAPAIMGTDPMAAQRVGEQIAEISAEAMARRLRSTGRVA